jgi:glycosyltransferase involved in cell wall biosynthesis
MARVSVIIPAFNAAATLAAAIDSALEQRFDGTLEVIVINDGSTDATPLVIGRYSERIRVIEQENRGPASARNAGTKIARGDYVAFLDSDDVWLPGKLLATLPILETEPKVILVYSDAKQIDADGAETAPSFVPAELAHAPSMADLLKRWWPILPSTVVMRRTAYDACGGFCEEFRHPGLEDPYMWLRAREHGDFAYIRRALVKYRVTPLVERMVKYESSYQWFAERVRERYGKAGDPLIKAVRHAHATALSHKGLIELQRGDQPEARHSFIRALRYEPFAPRIVLRLLRTFLPIPLARALSGRTRLSTVVDCPPPHGRGL